MQAGEHSKLRWALRPTRRNTIENQGRFLGAVRLQDVASESLCPIYRWQYVPKNTPLRPSP